MVPTFQDTLHMKSKVIFAFSFELQVLFTPLSAALAA
jgi:hypothetical protein